MQVLKIPGRGEVRWSARRQSLVTISHRLPIWEGTPPEYTYIPLKLKLPRTVMVNGDSLGVAEQIASALIQAARRPLPRRTGTVSLPVPMGGAPPSMGRINLEAGDFLRLRHALQAPPGELGSFQEDLPLLIVSWFFTDFVPAVVAASPKRQGISVYRLTRYLPAALLGAHSLVAKGERDLRLKRSINRIVVNDPELADYLLVCRNQGWNVDMALVVGLVDRAFRGAWEAARHPGLIYSASREVAFLVQMGHAPPPATRYRDPANVIHKYLYGPPRQALTATLRQAREKAKPDMPGVWSLTFDWWVRTYLGQPGAAAKEFLLT